MVGWMVGSDGIDVWMGGPGVQCHGLEGFPKSLKMLMNAFFFLSLPLLASNAVWEPKS